MTLKVQVDRDKCVAGGACVSLCSEVFDLDEEGYVVVLQESVNSVLEEDVRDAEDACPGRAIEILPE